VLGLESVGSAAAAAAKPAAGDAAGARQMAHDIASTAGNLGITDVANLAHALEKK
jgi:HPt (histidine-containing phosphotransfer) domain-containing protein